MLETREVPIDPFIAFEHRIAEACVNGRHDEVIRLLDERFIAVGFHGYEFDRRTYIDVLQKGSIFHSVKLRQATVLRNESTVVVTGLTEVDWTRAGVRASGPVRFTKVWTKRPQGWLILHLHVSDARVGEAWSQASKKP